MTQQAFSQYTGISSSVLSGIFTGRTKPTLKQVEAIRSKFHDISLDWLLFGEGSMHTAEPQATNKEVKADLSPTPGGGDEVQNTSQSASNGVIGVAVKGYGKNAANHTDMKNLDIMKRRITEIRVFYDDNTYEAFVPKNS